MIASAASFPYQKGERGWAGVASSTLAFHADISERFSMIEKLRRADAIARLGISKSTFDRHVREGKLTVERDSTELLAGHPAVYVTLAELGRYLGISDDTALRVRLELPVEKAEPQQTAPPVEQVPEQAERTINKQIPTEAEAPDAEAAIRDTVFQGRHTLLGPNPPVERRPSSVNDHIDPALRGDSFVAIGTDGEPVTHAGSANHPLLRDFKPIAAERIAPPKQDQKHLNRILFDVRKGWSR